MASDGKSGPAAAQKRAGGWKRVVRVALGLFLGALAGIVVGLVVGVGIAMAFGLL
jgi:hypothetical protein